MRGMMIGASFGTLIAGLVAVAGPAAGQSSASTYSYGTYNPVQAAINRDSMNAAVIRQATAGRHRTARHVVRRARKHRG